MVIIFVDYSFRKNSLLFTEVEPLKDKLDENALNHPKLDEKE